ncbi:hypothetical protein [Thiomicrorhabdus cannonii]|uniref:hypothetical protein n=1 Tax=Thiomicrorhabdus cannonii TaxID=2748011 RepID=UPI0015BA4990|nr:hypothetical protein [Thiomicrorhabdus cannonii]
MNDVLVRCVGEGAYITTSGGLNPGLPVCNSGSWESISYIQAVSSFDFSMLPPELAATYFGGGVLLYGMFWGVGRSLEAVFKVIK